MHATTTLLFVTALGATVGLAACAHQRDLNLVRAETAYDTASTDTASMTSCLERRWSRFRLRARK